MAISFRIFDDKYYVLNQFAIVYIPSNMKMTFAFQFDWAYQKANKFIFMLIFILNYRTYSFRNLK